MTCLFCGSQLCCDHGICDNCDEFCSQCWHQEQLEKDAEREAAFQRDVIGPMFGWEEE